MLVVWSDFFAASMPAGPLVPMSAHSISTIAKQPTATMTGTARGFRGSWELPKTELDRGAKITAITRVV